MYITNLYKNIIILYNNNHNSIVIIMISVIKLNDKSYYDTNELKKSYPVYFHKCGRSTRGILNPKRKKNINLPDYIYATCSKKNGWQLSQYYKTTPPPKAKLLLVENYVHKVEAF